MEGEIEVKEEQVADLSATEGDAKEQQAPVTEELTEKKEKKEKPWFQKRFDELTADKWEARRAAEEAKARADKAERELAELKAGKTQAETTADPARDQRTLSQKEVDELAEKKANEKVTIEAFNRRCDEVYHQGKELYGDFEEVLGNYRDLGGLTTEFIQAALETDAPAQVLYALGKDQDEAYRLLKLSPMKMAVEMTKLAVKVQKAPPKKVSEAPEPIRPRRGAAAPAPKSPDEMTTKEWMEWRDKELAKRASS